MPKIVRLVFTGGDCSGKTSALNYVAERLRNWGLMVFTIDEIATRFIKAGFASGVHTSQIEFERFICREQLSQEELFFNIAKSLDKDVIILCDRGVCDIAGFISREDLNDILKEYSLDYGRVLARYDGVFHLITAADGALGYYTQQTNEHRIMRDPQWVIDEDRKIKESWLGHNHFGVIANIKDGRPVPFSDKLKEVFKMVCRRLGIPVPLEIERKYFVGPIPDISRLPIYFQRVWIEQIYLTSEPGEERRIRKRSLDNDYCYYLTIKKNLNPLIRPENEVQISESEYINFLKFRDESRGAIRKNRYCFLWENQYFELDVFDNPRLDFALLEIELTEANDKVILPPFLNIVSEVTDDNRYTNYELAKRKNGANDS